LIYIVTYLGTDSSDFRNVFKHRYPDRYEELHVEDVRTLPFQREIHDEDVYIYLWEAGKTIIHKLAITNHPVHTASYNASVVAHIQARQGEYLYGWADYAIAWSKASHYTARLKDLNTNAGWSIFDKLFSTDIQNKKLLSEYNEPVLPIWEDHLSLFYTAKMDVFYQVLGLEDKENASLPEWNTAISRLKSVVPASQKVLLDIDKLADARFDGVRRYVKNTALEMQKMSWQGILPLHIDVFLKQKLMPLDAHTPIYDYHLAYESSLPVSYTPPTLPQHREV